MSQTRSIPDMSWPLKTVLYGKDLSGYKKLVTEEWRPLVDYIDGIRCYVLYVNDQKRTGLVKMHHFTPEPDIEWEDTELDEQTLLEKYHFLYNGSNLYGGIDKLLKSGQI